MPGTPSAQHISCCLAGLGMPRSVYQHRCARAVAHSLAGPRGPLGQPALPKARALGKESCSLHGRRDTPGSPARCRQHDGHGHRMAVSDVCALGFAPSRVTLPARPQARGGAILFGSGAHRAGTSPKIHPSPSHFSVQRAPYASQHLSVGLVSSGRAVKDLGVLVPPYPRCVAPFSPRKPL